MPSRPSRVWLWGPVVAYMAFIFGLSSLSKTPPLPAGADKDLHAVLYFGLGVLLTRGVTQGFRAPVSLTTVLLVTAIAAAYGVSDEFHQWFVPPRSVEALDVLADTIGGALAALSLYAWGIISPRHGL